VVLGIGKKGDDGSLQKLDLNRNGYLQKDPSCNRKSKAELDREEVLDSSI